MPPSIDEGDELRGDHREDPGLFSYASLESRVPKSHPLRKTRKLVDEALQSMHQELGSTYANNGRPSIAPEQLIRALLLQILYSIRSERMLVEQLDYNLLFRWFVGLSADEHFSVDGTLIAALGVVEERAAQGRQRRRQPGRSGSKREPQPPRREPQQRGRRSATRHWNWLRT